MITKTRSIHSTLLVTLLCGVSTVSLLAQGPGGPPPDGGRGQHHGPPPSPLFDALDTNHDGVISADEISSAATSLKTLLKNGATDLKREDLRPSHPQGDHGPTDSADKGSRPHGDHGPADSSGKGHRPHDDANSQAGGPDGRPHQGPPPSPLFEALDVNHDGVISADEMSNASTSLKTLLKNGATQLTREELRPARPPQS